MSKGTENILRISKHAAYLLVKREHVCMFPSEERTFLHIAGHAFIDSLGDRISISYVRYQ